MKLVTIFESTDGTCWASKEYAEKDGRVFKRQFNEYITEGVGDHLSFPFDSAFEHDPFCKEFVARNKQAFIDEKTGQMSDGYHTFDELYDHRCLLALHVAKGHSNEYVKSWASKLHHDGTGFVGWFIMGLYMEGKWITYHLPDKYWDKAIEYCKVLDKAPEWDGHTSQDVIQRMMDAL